MSGNAESDFGFTGHYLHVLSGLYLTKYRAYSSELARWISRDPVNDPSVVFQMALEDGLDSPPSNTSASPEPLVSEESMLVEQAARRNPISREVDPGMCQPIPAGKDWRSDISIEIGKNRSVKKLFGADSLQALTIALKIR